MADPREPSSNPALNLTVEEALALIEKRWFDAPCDDFELLAAARRAALLPLRRTAEQLDRLAMDAENPDMSVAYILPREPMPQTLAERAEWRAKWSTESRSIRQRYRTRLDGHIIVYLREWARQINAAVAASGTCTEPTEADDG